jgi:hypothetical protein
MKVQIPCHGDSPAPSTRLARFTAKLLPETKAPTAKFRVVVLRAGKIFDFPAYGASRKVEDGSVRDADSAAIGMFDAAVACVDSIH